jgi:hypothetical protein
MLISYFLGQKKYPIPYPTKKILIHLSLSILLGTASFYLFNKNPIIGNLILLMYLATVFVIDKKEIILLIKSRK